MADYECTHTHTKAILRCYARISLSPGSGCIMEFLSHYVTQSSYTSPSYYSQPPDEDEEELKEEWEGERKADEPDNERVAEVEGKLEKEREAGGWRNGRSGG